MRIVSPTHFVYDFSRKMPVMLCSLTDQILLPKLPLRLEALVNIYIGIVC